MTDLTSRFLGCFLGGAVGDALGAPVEFDSWSEIVAEYGRAGIQDSPPVITESVPSPTIRR